MKTVKFLGGLGNQMFQFAFYLSLKRHFKKVKADLSGFKNYELHNGFELERVFNIQLDRLSDFKINLHSPDRHEWIWRKLRHVYGTKSSFFYEQKEFGFDELLFNDKKNRHYWGYWQHINYVEPVQEELRTSFVFSELIDSRNILLQGIVENSNSVSVHVRRGDYLKHPVLGGICEAEYYKKAFGLVDKKVEKPLFVFFSNDIIWCEENLRTENSLFVNWNQGVDSYLDMQLMSLCKHHIIANSSFSWWGAWLNSSPTKIVISPSKWINDPAIDVSGILIRDFIKV